MKEKNFLFRKVVLCVMVWVFCLAGMGYAETNYEKKENWAYLGIGSEKAIDLFLLAPTVSGGNRNRCNISLADQPVKENFVGALNMERGIYEPTCRMYAPYYRQVTAYAYRLPEAIAKQHFDLAYQDVRTAFCHYLKTYNAGRPFILAGFSQGSQMALRLMKEFFGEEQLRKRLVAAYLIGWPVTEEDLVAYPHLQMAQGESDLGVIVTFNTEAKKVKRSKIVPNKTLAINPLNWRTDDQVALAELNLGAVFTNKSGGIIKEIPAYTGAYLDRRRGTLKVLDVLIKDFPSSYPSDQRGVYHMYDYQFFYRNLEKNVGVRAAEYQKIKSSE